MTIQADEIVEYRGRQYDFKGQPLESYIQENNLNFEIYSTANWRGYQGYWKIENNQLYLTEIKSKNLTIVDIFNTNMPVMAKWYSGKILIGLGEPEFGEWITYYEYYLWLDIVNGVVEQRKIIKTIEGDFIIDFGQYKEKYLSDILKGKIATTFSTNDPIRKYIQEIISFLKESTYTKKIIVPYLITDKSKKIIEELGDSNFTYLLTDDFCAAGGGDNAELFSQLLEQILSSDYNCNDFTIKGFLQKESNFTEIISLNPDFNYLEWALKNVEKFSIAPSLINTSVKTKFLRKFNINRLNSTIFEYKPDIEEIQYAFTDDAKNINLFKFQNKHQVIYNSHYGIYILNLPIEELQEYYGHYLDESYISSKSNKHEKNYDYEEYDDSPKYSEHNGAYGLDDNTINSAFEGEPENYWNID